MAELSSNIGMRFHLPYSLIFFWNRERTAGRKQNADTGKHTFYIHIGKMRAPLFPNFPTVPGQLSHPLIQFATNLKFFRQIPSHKTLPLRAILITASMIHHDALCGLQHVKYKHAVLPIKKIRKENSFLNKQIFVVQFIPCRIQHPAAIEFRQAPS